MGIIFDNNVEETKIYEAYGLTVYGKINRYVWSIYNDRPEENALITIRIVNADENNIFSMYMGDVILQSRIDDTLDNFLWWIVEDNPDEYTIEKQVYKSLCRSDWLFNHSINNRKLKQRQDEEKKKRIAERERKERESLERIKEYCTHKGLFYYVDYGNITIIKANTNNDRKILAEVQQKNDMDRMKQFVEFIRKYPENKSAKIITSGTIEEVLDYIK